MSKARNFELTSAEAGKFGFALDKTNGETAFVPPLLLERYNLKVGRNYPMFVTANTSAKADTTPWLVVGIDDTPDPGPVIALEEEVLEIVKAGGLWTPADLRDELQCDLTAVNMTVLHLVRRGDLLEVRAGFDRMAVVSSIDEFEEIAIFSRKIEES